MTKVVLGSLNVAHAGRVTLEVGLSDASEPSSDVSGGLHLTEPSEESQYIAYQIQYGGAASIAYERIVFNFRDVCEAFALGRDVRWREIGRDTEECDDWTPHVLNVGFASGGCFELIGDDDAELFVTTREGATLEAILYLDVAAYHPLFYFSSETRIPLPGSRRSAGTRRAGRVGFRLRAGAGPERLGWWVRSRLPFGYQAAFVLTDHADDDQLDAIGAVFFGRWPRVTGESGGGILGHGLTATKSVFVHAHAGYSAIGLNEPKFASLIWELQQAGIEVAAHLTRTVPTGRDELRQDLSTLSRYHVETWIDHHYELPQAVTVQGWNPRSDYYSLDLLAEAGIRFLWSYWDLSVDPPKGVLNQLAGRRGETVARLRRGLRVFVRPALGRRRREGLFELWLALAGTVGQDLQRTMRGVAAAMGFLGAEKKKSLGDAASELVRRLATRAEVDDDWFVDCPRVFFTNSWLDVGQPLPQDIEIVFKYASNQYISEDPLTLSEPPFDEAFQGAKRTELGDGVVTYRRNLAIDDPTASITWLAFHKDKFFLVCTYRPQILSESDQSAIVC